jgi:hypothetical protein
LITSSWRGARAPCRSACREAARPSARLTAAFGRADRPVDVCRCCALVFRCGWPRPAPCPAAGDPVLLTDPRLVLPPKLYRCAARELRRDCRHLGGEVFLRRDDVIILRMMARPRRQLAEDERALTAFKGATLPDRGCSAAPVRVNVISRRRFRTDWPNKLQSGTLVGLNCLDLCQCLLSSPGIEISMSAA